MRRLLDLAVLWASCFDPKWRGVDERLGARGLLRKVALCAVARPLLWVLNALVRDGCDYERMACEGAGG